MSFLTVLRVCPYLVFVKGYIILLNKIALVFIIFKSKILLVSWFLLLPRHLLIVGNLKMLSCNAVWGKVIEHCGSKLLIPPPPPPLFFHNIIRQNLFSSLDSLRFMPINYGKNRSP